MTTTTMTTPVSRNPIVSVIRLHFVNPMATIGMPWAILGAIFAANLAVWGIILASAAEADRAKISEGLGYSGSVTFIFVYMMVVAVQAINATFPFALGYSSTRRNYYLGTAITFVLLSLVYSIGLSVLSAIELATDGWGLGGRMFSAMYLGDGSVLERWFIYFALLLFFFFTGSAAAAVWVRWKGLGLTAFFVGIAFLLIGLLALVGLTNSWEAVGDWLVRMGWVGSYAWSLLVTAVAAITGYFILRKATPKG